MASVDTLQIMFARVINSSKYADVNLCTSNYIHSVYVLQCLPIEKEVLNFVFLQDSRLKRFTIRKPAHNVSDIIRADILVYL